MTLLLLPGCTRNARQDPINAEPCAAHLGEIFLLLRSATPSDPVFPASLAELDDLTKNGQLFVCPSTRHAPGLVKDVESWTDYIYVASVRDVEAVPTAIIICPPKNHGGKWGYVGFNDGTVKRVGVAEVHKLLAEPWSRSTIATQAHITGMKTRVHVVLPKRSDLSVE